MAGGHILNTPLPEQQPSGAPGGDYQNIPTNEGMFGGIKAGAEKQLGEGLEKAGETGMALTTDWQTRQNDLYNVEVKSWYADQTTDLHSKFMNLEGKAALDALPQYKDNLDQLKKDALNRVTAPAAQLKLAESLTSIQDQYWRYWSGHAASQMNAYDKKVTGDAIASNASLAANALLVGDEVGFQRNLNAQDNEVRNFYEAQHLPGDMIEQEVAKRRGQTLKSIIETVADGGDVGKANALFDQFKGRMDPQSIQAITSKLKGVNNQIDAIKIVDGETAPHAPMEIASKFIGMNEVKDRGVLASFIEKVGGQKVDPALTPWCAAWTNAVLRQAGYSGTGSAAARSFLTYGQAVEAPQSGDIVVLSRGADPSKGHVGFYAGPGDTPGTVKILGGNQNNSVSVSEFPVASVLGYRRLGPTDVSGRLPPVGPGPAAFVDQSKSDVMARVLDRQDLRDNPLLRNAVVSEINRRFTVQQAGFADQERDWKIKEHQEKEQFKAGVDEMLGGIQANDPTWNSARVLADPRFAYNREHALQLVQRPVMGEPDARQSALVRRQFEERMGLPQGDPNKLTMESEIYSRFSEMTTKDYQAVRKDFRDMRDEGGQRLVERKKEFLDGIKARFRSMDNLTGELFGEAGQQFDLFRNDLQHRIEQYQKEKKDPFDLMDPNKADYIGNFDNVNSYKRPLQEQLGDRARKVNPPLAPAPEAAAPAAIPKRLPDETMDQWLKRTGRNPFVQPVQNAQPQVPMSQ